VREQQEATGESQAVTSRLVLDIVLYSVARLGMLVAVTAVLVLFGVPLLVAAVVSVVVVMPLSMLVFGRLRRRVAAGMAERSAHRRARREELRAQLRGERGRDADSGDSGRDDR
jgi:ABC-type bacteriocin/lantibiotic exporter with double-glycine peptidase domain